MIVKDEITGDYLGIQCDVCETMAPDADAIREGHGLNNMGWHCSGGSHLCPSHAPPQEAARLVMKDIPVETLITVGARIRVDDDPTVWEIVRFENGGAVAKVVNGTGR